MKTRIILSSLASLLILLLMDEALGFSPKLRKIPSPSIQEITNPQLSKGDLLEIKGQGFIANYPSAHQVYLIIKTGKKKSKKIKLETIESSANFLSVRIPEDIKYHDYKLAVRIKSRLLKSKYRKSPTVIGIRPKAPAKPKLEYKVLAEINNSQSLIKSTSLADKKLIYDFPKLQVGKNAVKAFYIEEGFESIKSEAEEFFYLPKEEFTEALRISSEEPLRAIAISQEGKEYDVSKVTESRIRELEKTYYLVTPNNPEYLARQITQSPIYIKELHVKSNEYAVIKNRSNLEQDLDKCYLADSIRKRHEIKNLIITAKNEVKIEENLGLNDTSPDSLSIYCPEERFTVESNNEMSELKEDGFLLIDKFEYDELDEDFAIKKN